VTAPRSPAGARRRIGSGLLAAAAGLGLSVAGCSSSPAPSAPSLTDVRALLARHGRAVLAHDRPAFLADVDGSGAPAAFRARQAGEFANLVRLPLSSWSYTVERATDDHAAEAAATKKYGAKALIVRVSLRYALRGVDTTPTSHDLWWTFVRHDGRVQLAGDDGLADAGGVSWQGPWDFGPLQIVTGSSSLVLGHADNAAALPAIARTVDAAIPAVSAVWGTGWTRDVAVVVPSSSAEFSAQTGAPSQSLATTAPDQIAALAISDGTDPASGAVYGQRLIVNPAALSRLSVIGRQITIRHEVTHIATARATTDASPRWLVEGFADYVGNLRSGQPVTVAAAELRADVRAGRGPTALPGDADFDTDGRSAQAYEGAWLACRLIAERAGVAGLVRFYRLVGSSPADPDAAVGVALRSVMHETTARFTTQWRTYLQTELR
jgi:hypothetical protein